MPPHKKIFARIGTDMALSPQVRCSSVNFFIILRLLAINMIYVFIYAHFPQHLSIKCDVILSTQIAYHLFLVFTPRLFFFFFFAILNNICGNCLFCSQYIEMQIAFKKIICQPPVKFLFLTVFRLFYVIYVDSDVRNEIRIIGWLFFFFQHFNNVISFFSGMYAHVHLF